MEPYVRRRQDKSLRMAEGPLGLFLADCAATLRGAYDLLAARSEGPRFRRHDANDEIRDRGPRTRSVTAELGCGSSVQKTKLTKNLRLFPATSIAANLCRSVNPSEHAVVLSTIHSAKGLEWDAVFLAGMEDGVLLHANADDIEEERRIAYVGATRASGHNRYTPNTNPKMN